jgi:hypothetical protein
MRSVFSNHPEIAGLAKSHDDQNATFLLWTKGFQAQRANVMAAWQG